MGDILNNLPNIPAIPENIIGDISGAFSPEQIMAKAVAFGQGLLAKLLGMIPESVMNIYNQHTVLCMLAAICILALIAYEGYRFFKAIAYTGSAFLFGLVGYWYIAPALADKLQPMIPDILDYKATVAVACSALAIVLCRYAFNFVLLAIGGGAGFILGSGMVYNYIVAYFNTLPFLQSDNVKKIVGGVVAVIAAILCVMLFKLVFSLATSFGGMVGAAVLLQMILIPAAEQQVKTVFIAAGVVLGIVAIIRQRKQENDLVFTF